MGILSLLKSKNYGRIAHSACERYLNRPLPKWLAKRIAGANKKEFNLSGDNRLLLESYDGSNQIVHPDFLHWNGKLRLVCTQEIKVLGCQGLPRDLVIWHKGCILKITQKQQTAAARSLAC